MTIPALAQAAALFGIVLTLAAGFFFFVRNWTGQTDDSREEASDMLTKFRDLHTRGGLSDEEYRTIKTKLAPDLGADVVSSIIGTEASSEGPAEDKKTIEYYLANRQSSSNDQDSPTFYEGEWSDEGDLEA